ncbi:hypothetical protein [Streptomyces luteogriseus]|uniref:hypothetical protein n=1 Tax=Streptomyces luteogriseus TaxID=68233 RepID=UPI0037AB79A1
MSTDPFANAAAQQGGWLMALGNHIGAAVPGEPLQVKAAIWQSGGANTEVHPVKVRWKVDYYGCRLSNDDVQWCDFGQTVQAPTLNTDKVFPEVNASFTVPTTECTQQVPIEGGRVRQLRDAGSHLGKRGRQVRALARAQFQAPPVQGEQGPPATPLHLGCPPLREVGIAHGGGEHRLR